MSAGERFTMVMCGMAFLALCIFEVSRSGDPFFPIIEGLIAAAFFGLAALTGRSR